jgi:hypothetical protein
MMGLTLLLSALVVLAAPAATLQFGRKGAAWALAATALVLAANFAAGQLSDDPEYVGAAQAVAIWLAIAASVAVLGAYLLSVIRARSAAQLGSGE